MTESHLLAAAARRRRRRGQPRSRADGPAVTAYGHCRAGGHGVPVPDGPSLRLPTAGSEALAAWARVPPRRPRGRD